MHAYITDSNERRDIPLVLAAISIGLSISVSTLFSSLQITIPGWIDVTSVPGYYALLYMLFDKFCWRVPFLHRLNVIKVPALAGLWRGYVLSSFDDHREKHEIHLRIEQDWTQIRISLEGSLSRSHSFLAAVFTNAPEGMLLDYEYQNEPQPGAKDTMQIHHGTARLNVISDSVMDGYYYTGRGRGNYGRIYLARVVAAAERQ